MNKKNIICLISLSTFVFSCSNPVTNTSNIQKVEKLSDKTIEGEVIFPEKLSTKATSADIAEKSTVTLIYPSDYSDATLRNKAIAAGITDNTGKFKINNLDIPNEALSSVFVLEARKRKGGTGTSLMSLKTNVKWDGSKWQSIINNKISINVNTTVLSIISTINPTDLSPENSLNKITKNNDNTYTFQSINQKVDSDIPKIKDYINVAINYNLDPVKLIYHYKDESIDTYSSDYLSNKDTKVKTNVLDFRDMLRKYEEHYYNYTSNIDDIINYNKNLTGYSELKNPYDDVNPAFGTVILYDDYIDAITNLTYKGTTLTSKADLKGLVVYRASNDLSNYELYALNSYGEFFIDHTGIYSSSN